MVRGFLFCCATSRQTNKQILSDKTENLLTKSGLSRLFVFLYGCNDDVCESEIHGTRWK